VITGRSLWKWVVVAGVALGTVLGLGSGLFAAAPRPLPKVRPPVVRPPLRPWRYARRVHFWHPYARLQPAPRVWAALGYTYYAGGTDYVTAAGEETGVGARLGQIQSLVDMVHEWRMINESPDVHKRVTEDEGLRAVLASIRAANQEFDQATRQAMAELVEARDAATQLATARAALERITEAVERLPEK